MHMEWSIWARVLQTLDIAYTLLEKMSWGAAQHSSAQDPLSLIVGVCSIPDLSDTVEVHLMRYSTLSKQNKKLIFSSRHPPLFKSVHHSFSTCILSCIKIKSKLHLSWKMSWDAHHLQHQIFNLFKTSTTYVYSSCTMPLEIRKYCR